MTTRQNSFLKLSSCPQVMNRIEFFHLHALVEKQFKNAINPFQNLSCRITSHKESCKQLDETNQTTQSHYLLTVLFNRKRFSNTHTHQPKQCEWIAICQTFFRFSVEKLVNSIWVSVSSSLNYFISLVFFLIVFDVLKYLLFLSPSSCEWRVILRVQKILTSLNANRRNKEVLIWIFIFFVKW